MENYEIVSGIGKGAFGKVSIVRNLTDGLKYVLKELPLENKSTKEIAGAHKELRLLTELKHPNIVQLVEHWTTDQAIMIIMEYAEGGDLERAIVGATKAKTPFPEEQVMAWIVQVLLGLRHMHGLKILHRDLKTANIFLTKSGVAKLGDFGFSKQLTNTLETTQTMCGTPYYLAPEKFKGQGYTSKVDVWALGVIMFELLMLRKPWSARTFAELRAKVINDPVPTFEGMGFSLDTTMLCTSMLSKVQSARPSVAAILSSTFLKREMNRIGEEFQVKQMAAASSLETIILSIPHRKSSSVADPPPPVPPPRRLVPGNVVPTSGVAGAQQGMRPTAAMMRELMAGPRPVPTAPPDTPSPPRLRHPSIVPETAVPPRLLDTAVPIDTRAAAATLAQTAELYRSMQFDLMRQDAVDLDDEECSPIGQGGERDALLRVLDDALLQRAVAVYQSDVSIEEGHEKARAMLGPKLAHLAQDIQQFALASLK